MSHGAVVSQPQGDKHQEMQMSPHPVVVQPHMGQVPPGNMMMMGPPMNAILPAGLPPGLAYLATLNEVHIHQILELAEALPKTDQTFFLPNLAFSKSFVKFLIGWERNNRYDICNNQSQKFMFAKEDTDCCTRQFCGTARPFVMNVTDNNGQNLMMMKRPFRCQASWFWCCWLQEMEIESPPGVLQGTVKQAWTFWTPKYKVFDSQNQCVFTIIGDCCYCKCCADVIFRVFDGDSEEGEVGEIVKHWGGCREIFGGANDFSLKFFSDMDIMKKMLLFGSTFLIDFNYFEYKRNN